MRCEWLIAMALGSGVWACSGSAGEPELGSAGAAANSAGSGNGGASAAGAGVSAGAGGQRANGGSAGVANSAGAAGSVLAGGSGGDSSGTSACPVWPRTRLMPLIGPFFYGPDPGPCSDLGGPYTYEAGRLQSQLDQGSSRTTTYSYDAQGLPTGTMSSDQTSSIFEFGADYLLDTEKDKLGGIQRQIRYMLSPAGYPTTFTISGAGSPDQFGTYTYSDCKLVGRTVMAQGAEPRILSYSYDSVGHLTARTCGGCIDENMYDYSCWK